MVSLSKSAIRTAFLAAPFIFSMLGHATLPLGVAPPSLTLEEGLDDKNWQAQSAFSSDQVHIIFYAAPSKKELNKKASDAITARIEDPTAKDFKRINIRSWGVINMKASAWPDWIISKKIAATQKEFPHTTLVKDYNRKVVTSWNLADNSSDVVVIGHGGKVVFSQDGALGPQDIQKLLTVVEDNVKLILADKAKPAPVRAEAKPRLSSQG